MAAGSTRSAAQQHAPSLSSLSPAERSEVLDALLTAHPELIGESERIASGLLADVSVEQVASDVESGLSWISLDALAARAGRVRGRGYVHESEAAWELVEEAIEPFRSDLNRRAALGLIDAATNLAIGIVAGLYRTRDAEMGTVLAYAGDDTAMEVAEEILRLAAKLGVPLPDEASGRHWPDWRELP